MAQFSFYHVYMKISFLGEEFRFTTPPKPPKRIYSECEMSQIKAHIARKTITFPRCLDSFVECVFGGQVFPLTTIHDFFPQELFPYVLLEVHII